MTPEFRIGDRLIGPDHAPLIIAEIGINHGGDLQVAKTMAKAAVDAGAEIIKHQTHVLDDEMSPHAKNVIPGNTNESIWDVMEKNSLNLEEEKEFKAYVEQLNALFISTPFSRTAADWLNDQNVPAFKIGSGEIDNLPLIRHVARFGKPMIMSTGMQDIDGVRAAVDIVRQANVPFALLHCVNLYPTPPHLVKLGSIREIEQAFPDAVVGYSDHSIGLEPCLGAVALGANIIERHFTDEMSRPGPDIVCSMDPEELAALIRGSRILFQARSGNKSRSLEEEVTYKFARASVIAIQSISKGDLFDDENIWVRRPGTGEISAMEYDGLIGKQATRDINVSEQLRWKDVL